MTALETAQWPIKSVAYRANLCHVSLGASILIKALHVLHASPLNVARTDVTTQRVLVQGQSKWVDRVDNVQGSKWTPKTTGEKKKIKGDTIGLGAITVSCPWAPEASGGPNQN